MFPTKAANAAFCFFVLCRVIPDIAFIIIRQLPSLPF
jgi:hypothetical protein